jgi:xylulokinase
MKLHHAERDAYYDVYNSRMNILALDVGLGKVQAAVLDSETAANIGPAAQTTFVLDEPTPEASEVPADRLWQAVTSAARAAMRNSGVTGKAGQDVQAVVLSCFTPGLVLLDKKDQPVRPIWTHRDRRARPAARQVSGAVGQEFLAGTGNRPLPGLISAVSLRHMYTLDPYLLHEIRSYLHVNGWLGFVITGEKALDPANASFTGLFGTMTDQRWSSRWCDYFEVDQNWLPQIFSGNADLGTVRADVAAELGVPGGIPCKIGSAANTGIMLAANMEPGDLLHESGDMQVLTVMTDKPVPAPERLTRLFGVGNSFVHTTYNPVGPTALDWLHQLCFREQSRDEFFAKTISAALGRSKRITLDPPYLAGNPLDIEAQRAAFRDLELTTDRLDLLAALLQTMIRRQRDAVAALDTPIKRVVFSGDNIEIWRRLLPEYQDSRLFFKFPFK